MIHNPLFFAAIFLGLAAVVVTVYAFCTAEEGYEDEEGFHSVSSPEEPTTDGKESAEHADIPPFPTGP
jgi:hypothetical protein